MQKRNRVSFFNNIVQIKTDFQKLDFALNEHKVMPFSLLMLSKVWQQKYSLYISFILSFRINSSPPSIREIHRTTLLFFRLSCVNVV